MNLLYVRAEIMSLMKQEVKKDLREMERDLVFARRPVPRYVCWLASEAFLLFLFLIPRFSRSERKIALPDTVAPFPPIVDHFPL